MAARFKLSIIHLLWIVYGVIRISPCLSESASNTGPVATTTSGQVRGSWLTIGDNRTIEAYLSIPYAVPPVGPRRFKDPEPFGSWQGLLDGTKEPTKCLQANAITSEKKVEGSEDCLYLNVYTPLSSGEYPVMVFIHGGGFVDGYAGSDIYGPDKLLMKDVVLVTMHYRLGFLGFASYNDPNFSGNYGLKDQSLALKWVKNNIASFGGDVRSITVFGESAGAASAHYHVLSPQNEGVFHRAILMSGSADCPWAVSTRTQNGNFTAEMGKLVNCSQTSATELLECLRKVDGSLLLSYNDKFQTVWKGVPLVVFRPTLESSDNEKAFISEQSFKREPPIPIMIGATSSEGTLVLAIWKRDNTRSLEQVLSELDKKFPEIISVDANFQDTDPNAKERAAQIRKAYFGDQTISNETLHQITNLYSDIYFLNGIKSTIKRHKAEKFVYKFGYEGSYSISQLISGDRNYKKGVCHADDLLYLFPMKPFISAREKDESDKEKEISRKMVDLFTNFAANGNPNHASNMKINWTQSTDNLEYLSITPEGNFEMKMNFPETS